MAAEASDGLTVCTHCGFTWGEFRARRLLGCPHCYACFAVPLSRALLQLQPDGKDAPFIDDRTFASLAKDGEGPAQWRERLADALRHENYEEAARLRKLLGHGTGKSDGPAEAGT